MPDSAEVFVKAPVREIDAITAETGLPPKNRRLSDKVLAAFNHAYAVGEIDVATQLREILAKLEYNRVIAYSDRKATPVALSHADLWVEFVEARNDYRVACEDGSLDGEGVARFLEKMKDAYQRWSSV